MKTRASPEQADFFESPAVVEQPPRLTIRRGDSIATPPTPRQQGDLGREIGMSRAIDHARACSPLWSQHAEAWLRRFAARGLPFTTHDVSVSAYAAGLPQPPDPRAWGGLVRALVTAGVIKRLGFVQHGTKTTHTHPVSQWVGHDKLCPHGKRGECNACDFAGDLAFDSAREDRAFGRGR